jgi:N-acetylglutamate synthase-like GNAT family acetyltransferase
MTEVRVVDVKDFYETMSKWWISHGWAPLPINSLPEKVFVLSRDKKDVYCCTLYETNSDFGVVAWQLSNKEIEKESGDLQLLFDSIEDYARELGISILFTTSKTFTVEESLKSCGYLLGDTQVNQYLKWVKQ